MNTLKIKIYQLIANVISVEVFENWLYNSNYVNNNLKEKDFAFDVVNINYRDENYKELLKQLIKQRFDIKLFKIISIIHACSKIITSDNPKEIYRLINKNKLKFHQHEDYDILWKFYNLECSFYQSEYTNIPECLLVKEAKFYAKQVIVFTKYCQNIEEINNALESELETFIFRKPNKELNLKQKIFAFFKKS